MWNKPWKRRNRHFLSTISQKTSPWKCQRSADTDQRKDQRGIS